MNSGQSRPAEARSRASPAEKRACVALAPSSPRPRASSVVPLRSFALAREASRENFCFPASRTKALLGDRAQFFRQRRLQKPKLARDFSATKRPRAKSEPISAVTELRATKTSLARAKPSFARRDEAPKTPRSNLRCTPGGDGPPPDQNAVREGLYSAQAAETNPGTGPALPGKHRPQPALSLQHCQISNVFRSNLTPVSPRLEVRAIRPRRSARQAFEQARRRGPTRG